MLVFLLELGNQKNNNSWSGLSGGSVTTAAVSLTNHKLVFYLTTNHTHCIFHDYLTLNTFFFIRNRFIRNQYSNFFGIKKPSTHVPSSKHKKLSSHFSKKIRVFVQKWRKSRSDKKPRRNWVLETLRNWVLISELSFL